MDDEFHSKLILSIFHFELKIMCFIEKGTDVDVWTMDELVNVVDEFKANYNEPVYEQNEPNFD